MELTLIRIEDLPEIAAASLRGDAVATGLLVAVRSFTAHSAGKECFICTQFFGLEVTPAAFWVSDRVAIGVCTDCARQSDRRLRRRVQRYELDTFGL
jgi:hypothetical protein